MFSVGVEQNCVRAQTNESADTGPALESTFLLCALRDAQKKKKMMLLVWRALCKTSLFKSVLLWNLIVHGDEMLLTDILALLCGLIDLKIFEIISVYLCVGVWVCDACVAVRRQLSGVSCYHVCLGIQFSSSGLAGGAFSAEPSCWPHTVWL